MNELENDILLSKIDELYAIERGYHDAQDDAPNVTRNMEAYSEESVILREVNPDGVVYPQRLPFPIRGIVIQNFSTVTLNVTFTDGTTVAIAAGFIIKMIPPTTNQFKAGTASVGSGYIAILCYPQYLIPDAINFSAGGGTATAVEVLDGSGVNKLAVDASGKIGVNALPALPAGTNAIGSVEVLDGAGTNKLAVNASGQVALSNFPAMQAVSVASGQVVDGGITTLGTEADVAYVSGSGTLIAVAKGIFGRLANIVSLVFNAAGSLIVDDRAAANQSATQVSVATTAGGTSIVASRATRKSVSIRNTDTTNPVYLGASGLTAATGFLLKAGESITLQNTTAIFGLATGSAVTVCAFEEYS